MDQCQVSARRATYLLQKLVGQGLLSQQGAVRGTTYTWPETDERNNVRSCTVITPLHIIKTKATGLCCFSLSSGLGDHQPHGQNKGVLYIVSMNT